MRFIEEKSKVFGLEMLEIGCAGGGIVRAFEESGYNSLGVDLSEIHIQYGKKRDKNNSDVCMIDNYLSNTNPKKLGVWVDVRKYGSRG